MDNNKKTGLLYQGVMLLAVFPAMLLALIGWKLAAGVIPAFVFLIVGLAAAAVPLAGFILCASRMLAGKGPSKSCFILQIVTGGVLAAQIIFTIVGICLSMY